MENIDTAAGVCRFFFQVKFATSLLASFAGDNFTKGPVGPTKWISIWVGKTEKQKERKKERKKERTKAR